MALSTSVFASDMASGDAAVENEDPTLAVEVGVKVRGRVAAREVVAVTRGAEREAKWEETVARRRAANIRN